MMVERLLLSTLIAAVACGLYLLFQWIQRQQVARHFVGARVAGGSRQPTVLYFRSDTCSTCATQAHYLREVTARGALVETIDVVAEPERAATFNIMTLPTTVVIAADGKVSGINYGLIRPEALARQLELTL